MNENESIYSESNVYIENRKSMRITGVTDVDSFSEETISLQTHAGDLIISGQTLKIAKLDVESGEMLVEGLVVSLIYSQNTAAKKDSFLGKLFG